MKKSSLAIDAARVEEARTQLRERARDESWSEIARAIGLPKTTVYHFAKLNYIPKDGKILARLIGDDVFLSGYLVVPIHRDARGRFRKS